jgi:hypothetical protein
MGAATRLRELYDLRGCEAPGCSAGALAAVLSQHKVDPQEAHRIAFSLADEAHVFTNPLGLACKWGRLVEAWLRQLLPEEIDSVPEGSAAVVVITRMTPLPRLARITRFVSREQLISCLMGSTHIPWFMDGNFSRVLRGVGGETKGDDVIRAVDGGFLEFCGLATNHDLLMHGAPEGSAAVFLDAARDTAFMEACEAHGWSRLKPTGTEHFIEYGARYIEAQTALGQAGELAPLAPYLRERALAGSKVQDADARGSTQQSWRRLLPPMTARARPGLVLASMAPRLLVAMVCVLLASVAIAVLDREDVWG